MLLASAAFGQTPTRLVDYALVLEDPPVARKVASRAALHGAVAQAHLQRIRSAQSGVLAELARRNVKVTSTAQTLLNAVFVTATREEAAQLAGMPGVVRVVHLPRYKPALDKAVGLVNLPVGGVLERRSRHQDRDHRFGNRPESPGIPGRVANTAVRFPQGRCQLHQQQGDCGAQLRGAGCGVYSIPRTTTRRATTWATERPSP